MFTRTYNSFIVNPKVGNKVIDLFHYSFEIKFILLFNYLFSLKFSSYIESAYFINKVTKLFFYYYIPSTSNFIRQVERKVKTCRIRCRDS